MSIVLVNNNNNQINNNRQHNLQFVHPELTMQKRLRMEAMEM